MSRGRQRVVAGAPECHHNPDQHRQLPLQASRRTHSEDGPHEEAQVEPADVDEQPLQDVGVAPQVGATHPAGLVEMRVRPFQVLAAVALQSPAPRTPDAPPVRVDRVARQRVFRPLPPAAIRLRDVRP